MGSNSAQTDGLGGAAAADDKDGGCGTRQLRCVVEVPAGVTPGKTKIEVAVPGPSAVRFLVPAGAKPGDTVELVQAPGGAWKCTVRCGGGHQEQAVPAAPRAAAAEQPVAQPGAVAAGPAATAAGQPASGVPTGPRLTRRLTAVLPADTQPGKTPVALDIGDGEQLVVTAPAEARPGDELEFVLEESSQEWRCRLRQATRVPPQLSRGGCAGDDEGDSAPPEEVHCHVPADATPGRTKLKLMVENAGPDGHVLAVVPDGAREGELLSVLAWPDGTTCANVVQAQDEDCAPAVMQLPTPLMDEPAKQQNHLDLVAAVIAGGAHISGKLRREVSTTLGVPGTVAVEAVQAGEVLLDIPSSLFFSARRARQLHPELADAVDQVEKRLHGRNHEAFHALCLSAHMAEAQQHAAGPGAASHGEGGAGGAGARDLRQWTADPLDGGQAATLAVWKLFCASLASEDFRQHPHWLSRFPGGELNSALWPSGEPDYCGLMLSDALAVHRCLGRYVRPELTGGARIPDAGMFVQARLSIHTRVFQLGEDTCLVPVMDCFNHATEADASWAWCPETSSARLTADRPIGVGQEITLSYGRRSNVLLYRTYGFTLPPEIEPDWTFAVQAGSKPEGLLERYLPASRAKMAIHLEANAVQNCLVDALNACVDNKTDPEAFLRELCSTCSARYESDHTLAPALDALRMCREASPTSHAWWEFLEHDNQAPHGDTLRLNTLRVKMCEYLCLVAHTEVLDVVAGTVEEGNCLELAAPVRAVLVECMRILRDGSRFSLLSQASSGGSP